MGRTGEGKEAGRARWYLPRTRWLYKTTCPSWLVEEMAIAGCLSWASNVLMVYSAFPLEGRIWKNEDWVDQDGARCGTKITQGTRDMREGFCSPAPA